MRPEGLKITKPSTSKGYSCANAVYHKYGKDVSVHDYIQAGGDGTIAADIIKKAGGIRNLKGANENLPTSDICIDLNLDPYTANKIVKAGKIAQEKINRDMAAKRLAEKEKIENKETIE